MAGGATVIAALRAAALLSAPIKVIGVIPVAENMPGGRAIKPGDVLAGTSGKTGEVVLQPLEDDGRPLYPELEAYLASLPRIGTPIVLTAGSRGPSRPYAMVYAQRRVREAREKAGLGAHVTLDASHIMCSPSRRISGLRKKAMDAV